MEKVRIFKKLADELGVSMTQLAIAWILKNERVTSVILGVSSLEQFEENMGALKAKELLTDDVLKKIDKIFPVED